MTRIKPVEAALILKRIEADFPEEAKLLQSHLDTLTTEETWTILVREVVEGMAASRSAEERTSANLLGLKPLMERTTEALERMAEQERRRNDLEERRVKLDELRETSKEDRVTAGFKGIVVPAATAFIGAFTTAVGFYFSQ